MLFDAASTFVIKYKRVVKIDIYRALLYAKLVNAVIWGLADELCSAADAALKFSRFREKKKKN